MSEIASSSKAAVYVAPQIAAGTIPETPSWQTCTLTSCNIKEAPNTVESARIRADRNPTGSFTTTRSSSGDIADEVSYGGTTDTFLEALMCSTWATARTYTASTISTAAADNSINDSAGEMTVYVVGEKINVTGIATLTGVVVVSSTASKLVVSGETLTDIAAGTSTTIASQAQSVSIGTIEHPFLILKEFGDLAAGAGKYEQYKGEFVNQAAFSMGTDSLAGVTWSFVGREMNIPDYTSVTATAAASTDPMKGIATIATVDGSAYAYVTQLDLTVTNNIATTNFLNYGIDTSLGKVGITGTLTIGYTSAAFTEKYIADDTINLGWTLSDPAGNKYIFTLPKVRIGAVPTDINGSDSIKSGIEISAAYDGDTGVAMTIERRPA